MPRPFERKLIGHEVDHCSRRGWERLKNGALLSAAEDAGFHVIVSVDSGLEYQQNMTGRSISLLTLLVLKNDMPTVSAMADTVIQTLRTMKPGTFVILRHPDYR